jgi:mono/diheme cytochrome c family protein
MPNDLPPTTKDPDRVDYEETRDVSEVHAAIQREHAEPSAKVTPIPLWLTAICGAVLVWAGTYFGVFNGGLSGSVFNEYESSPAVLFPIPTQGGAGTGAVAEAPQTLAEQGKSVFSNCVPCHQATGTGVPGQFPPLAKSEWVNGSEKRMIAILLKGLQGPVTVIGAKNSYAGNMIAWESTLSNKKIAAVASYVRSQWGNTGPEISEAKVAAARKEFADRKVQWTEAELLQIPADATLPDAAGAAPAAAPAPAGAAPTAAAPSAPAAATPAPAPAATSAAPAPAPAAPAPAAAVSPELAASIERGKGIYMQTCFVCHQITGLGLPGVFPPLAQTEYTTGDSRRMVAMILKGVNPPLKVKGMTYAAQMPALPTVYPILNDDKNVADAINYVRNNFGNKDEKGVTPELVKAVREEFASRTTPWVEAELQSFGTPAAAVPAPAPSTPAPAAPAPEAAAPAPAVPPSPAPANPAPPAPASPQL